MKKIYFILFCSAVGVTTGAWGQAADMPPPVGAAEAEEGLHKGAQRAFEDQLSATRTALKLTPTQVPLWQTFEDKVRALMADMTRALPPAPESQAAPQKIDRSVDIVRDRLTAMEEIAAAAQAFYAQLDTKQKSIADLRLPITVPPLYSGLGPPARPPMMGGAMRGRRMGAPPQ